MCNKIETVFLRSLFFLSLFQLHKKKIQEEDDKNTEKIFVIESTPKQHKKIGYLIKNMLHIHKDSLELSFPKFDEGDNKVTRITPLNVWIDFNQMVFILLYCSIQYHFFKNF